MKRKYAMIFLFLALSLITVIPVSARRSKPRITTTTIAKDRIITIETKATDGATRGYGNVARGGTHSWSVDTWFVDAAYAHRGYYLASWEYDGVVLPNTTEITVLVTQGSHTLVAVFSPLPTPPPQLPPSDPIDYTLMISAVSCDGSPLPSGCVIDPAEGTHSYEAGQIATVTATASSDWFFDHWLLDDANRTDNPTSVEMTSNHTLVAVFNPILAPPPPPSPPPPLPESKNLTVYVVFCGDTRGYWKVVLSYLDEAPTSLTIKISTAVYAEILEYFNTVTFAAPYRNIVYSEAHYAGTQYYMAGHDLAIGVVGVASIQVELVS